MCDYSLQGLPNRLAVESEQLVTHRFRTQSMGMASPLDIAASCRPRPQTGGHRSWWSALKHWLDPQMQLDQVPAVCIPPGARLLMDQIPHGLRQEFALDVVEDVTFVQLSADSNRHRDAILFGNGRKVLLQAFPEGICFEVLSLVSRDPEPDMEPLRLASIQRSE
jgi:hypothetical protein